MTSPRSPDRPDLTCDEAEALLPLVADGAIDATSEPQLFAHLARCPVCQDSLAAHDLIELSLQAPHPVRTPRCIVIRLPLPWAIAAAAGLLVGLYGMWTWLGRTPSVPNAACATLVKPVTAPDGSPAYEVGDREANDRPVRLIRRGDLDGQGQQEPLRLKVIPVQNR